jgi:hypothetical protein
MVSAIRYCFKVDHCFTIMSYDGLVYHLSNVYGHKHCLLVKWCGHTSAFHMWVKCKHWHKNGQTTLYVAIKNTIILNIMPNQESERSYMCVFLGVDVASFFDFLLYFGTVPTVWYFVFHFIPKLVNIHSILWKI